MINKIKFVHLNHLQIIESKPKGQYNNLFLINKISVRKSHYILKEMQKKKKTNKN